MKKMIPNILKPEDDELYESWISFLASDNGYDLKRFIKRFLYHNYSQGVCVETKNLDTIYEYNNSQNFPTPIEIVKKHSPFFVQMINVSWNKQAYVSEIMFRDPSKYITVMDGTYHEAKWMVCPICSKQDIKEEGRVIIHVPHMLNGVTCCYKHNVKLCVYQEDDTITLALEWERKFAKFMAELYFNPIALSKTEMMSAICIKLQEYKQDVLLPTGENLSVRQIKKLLRDCDGLKGKQNLKIMLIAFVLFETAENLRVAAGYLGQYCLEKQFYEVVGKEYIILSQSFPFVTLKHEICGSIFTIHMQSFIMGTRCPYCTQQLSEPEIIRKLLGTSKNEYELLEINKNNLKMRHKICGTVVEGDKYSMLWKRQGCFKCNMEKLRNNRTGEVRIANNGLAMVVIEDHGAHDLVIQFETGYIKQHVQYGNFIEGCVNYDAEELAAYKRKYEGLTNTTADGDVWTIIAYRGFSDIDIRYGDGTVGYHRSVSDFLVGKLPLRERKQKNTQEHAKERIGQKRIATNGQQMKIIEYKSYLNITVEFEDGTVRDNIRYRAFLKGNVRNPNCKNTRKVKNPYKSVRIGEEHTAKNGQNMKIIDYRNAMSLDVQFEDGTIVKNIQYDSFIQGKVRNPNVFKKKREDLVKERIGEEAVTTKGQKMKIIAYRSNIDIDVQFEDGTIKEHVRYNKFKSGYVSNPNYTIKKAGA